MKLLPKACTKYAYLLIAVLMCFPSDLFSQLQGGFNPNVSEGSYSNIEAYSFVVQADGKIVVAASNKLQRFNPDGTRDGVISTLPGTERCSTGYNTPRPATESVWPG